MTKRPVAFIGTRRLGQLHHTHPELVRLYRDAARWVARAGRVLHTGGADGADQAAALTALEAHGWVHLFRPDGDTHQRWCWKQRKLHEQRLTWTIYDPRYHPEWTASVDRYHPNPAALDAYGRRLMARNYGLVVGCSAVVALPASATDWGGTGQGMRIAQARGIPLYHLWEPEARARLERRIYAPEPEEPPADTGPDLMPPPESWPAHRCRPGGGRDLRRLLALCICADCHRWWEWIVPEWVEQEGRWEDRLGWWK